MGLHGIFFFFQAEDGIRDDLVTGVQTCALPICHAKHGSANTQLQGTNPWVLHSFTPFLVKKVKTQACVFSSSPFIGTARLRMQAMAYSLPCPLQAAPDLGQAWCANQRCTPSAMRAKTLSSVGTSAPHRDRKSTRLNSSHQIISYAVFCLKKKNS